MKCVLNGEMKVKMYLSNIPSSSCLFTLILWLDICRQEEVSLYPWIYVWNYRGIQLPETR